MSTSVHEFINSALIALLSAVLTVISSLYLAQRLRAQKRIEAAETLALANAKRFTDLENELAQLKNAIMPISQAFQAILVKELSHSHTRTMNSLLRKIVSPAKLADLEEHDDDV